MKPDGELDTFGTKDEDISPVPVNLECPNDSPNLLQFVYIFYEYTAHEFFTFTYC